MKLHPVPLVPGSGRWQRSKSPLRQLTFVTGESRETSCWESLSTDLTPITKQCQAMIAVKQYLPFSNRPVRLNTRKEGGGEGHVEGKAGWRLRLIAEFVHGRAVLCGSHSSQRCGFDPRHRRGSDGAIPDRDRRHAERHGPIRCQHVQDLEPAACELLGAHPVHRSEEHTSELQ